MSSVFRDFSVFLTSRFLLLGIGVFNQSLLAWYLQPTGRGEFAVCLLFSAILTVFFSFGLDGAGGYYIASGKLSPSEGICGTLMLLTLGAGVGMAVGWGLTYLPLSFFHKAPRSSFLLAVVLIPVTIWQQGLLQILAGLKEFRFYATLTTIHAGLVLTLTFVMLRLVAWEVNGALCAAIIGSLTISILAGFYLRRRYQVVFQRPRWRNVKAMVSYGARYFVASFTNMVNLQIGAFLLALFATRPEIGLFTVGSMLVGRFSVISDVVAAVIQPRIAGDPAGRPDLTAQCLRLLVVITGVVFVLIAIFATPIVRILFSPSFLPSVSIIRILLIGSFCACATKPIVSYLVGTNHPGTYSIVTIANTVVNFVLLLVLLPRLGLNGAAWAMSTSLVAGSLILIVSFIRLARLSTLQIYKPTAVDWELAANLCRKIVRKAGDGQRAFAREVEQ